MLSGSLKSGLLLIVCAVVGLSLAAAVVIQHFTAHFALAIIMAMIIGLVIGVITAGQFADSLIRRVQRLAAGARRVQSGDFSQDIDVLSHDEMRTLEEAVAGTVTSFRSMAQDTKQISYQVSRTDRQLSRLIKKVMGNNEGIDRLAQSIARGSERQARIVEQTAHSLGLELNQMDGLVRRAGQTVEKIDAARSQAARGEADARRTLAQLEKALEQMVRHTEPVYRLAQKVEKMKVVVDVMNEISRKTDLLSLNASIEATRAGELGRGFALVADEIRNMAVNSKQSAQQIARTVESLLEDNHLITDSLNQTQSAVGAGRESIHAIVATFGGMLSDVGVIAKQISEIEGVMHNQANQIRTLLEGFKELSILVEVNLASTRNTTRATENQKQDMLKIDQAMGALQEISERMLQTQQKYQLTCSPADEAPEADGDSDDD